MKKLIFVLFVFAAFLSAQEPCDNKTTGIYLVKTSKDGKTVTKKECMYVILCHDVVEFRVSPTEVRPFYKIDQNTWVNDANKVVERLETGGRMCFIDKKNIYYYELKQ